VGQQSPNTTDIENSNTHVTLPTCSTPCGPKKAAKSSPSTTITQAMLIKKQYEVLSVQKEKFKVEIEKIKLENIKLQLEISRLNQWAMNENDAIIALNAL
jgi:hypothetical protein